jgi:hypothetical protein
VANQHVTTGPAADAGNADSRLRELVLGYLDEHPTAMDTLDGIAEWWIRRQQIEIEVRRVSSVLQALVQQGVLEEAQQGGVRFFRRRSSGSSRTAALAEKEQ